jgi:hypothetical protein
MIAGKRIRRAGARAAGNAWLPCLARCASDARRAASSSNVDGSAGALARAAAAADRATATLAARTGRAGRAAVRPKRVDAGGSAAGRERQKSRRSQQESLPAPRLNTQSHALRSARSKPRLRRANSAKLLRFKATCSGTNGARHDAACRIAIQDSRGDRLTHFGQILSRGVTCRVDAEAHRHQYRCGAARTVTARPSRRSRTPCRSGLAGRRSSLATACACRLHKAR